MNILFSLEYALTERDIAHNSKGEIDKQHWLKRWNAGLQPAAGEDAESIPPMIPADKLMTAIHAERDKNAGKQATWFHLIMLEATLFRAYSPLGESRENDKRYNALKYASDRDYLKWIASVSRMMDPELIDRFEKTYKKVYDKHSGKAQKIALGVLIPIAAAGAVAATAGALAGPIAVALVGGNFAFHGAALVTASLAMLGGGAIAAGGAGVAGGVAVIVGGGALLGAAGGGAAVAGASTLIKENPDFALSQATKLEIVMREILLNTQQDVESAQKVITQLKEQIDELQSQLLEMKAIEKPTKEEKETCAQLQKTVKYLQSIYTDMVRFKSSYELALKTVSHAPAPKT